ncbi:electron transport complex subunit RsxC [Crenobacter sp. SG2303]|uniref:Ion-translocating oxidoreductase complex subunit C n=1 Tax=Crenobacter oryzisoli TaxID=3056844 RepID=A0ABT7XJU5_9NEIS|nr:electron transport complex subunit RsxC [Crenobacter sp. SG2303]MDN0074050.1 electron transport complex subunit RsxC [Crenobacter sp. SG2303]
MSKLYTFHGGIELPENKQQSTGRPIGTPPLPARLCLPLSQNLGNPAKPCVAVGDRVLKGQRIAEADGTVSAALHAPTSGTVVEIAPRAFAHPSGLAETAIVIEADGRDEWQPRQGFPLWQSAEPAEVRRFLRDMGVVGLGGSMFPTSLKLASETLDTLVINGAECEPYISCDDLLMRERAADIVAGIAIVTRLMQPKQVLIGIEDNKSEAIAAMRAACMNTPYRVVAVPTKYPSGSAKQLIRVLTGIEIPHGMRYTDMGVQCFNVGTVYSVCRAVEHGEPVISRIVTLSGAVARPQNVEALLGTPVTELMAWAGLSPRNDGVILGGPMTGFRLSDLSVGITKSSNCLLGSSPKLFPPRPPAMPCIRCGECADACPAKLQPMDLFWFAKTKDFGKAQERNLFDCIECGACSYVCPSQLPLVDYYRFAKSEIWAAERDKKASDRARSRHEFRLFRIEREKIEKAQRLAERSTAAKAAPQTATTAGTNSHLTPSAEDKSAAIKAAMERAAALKATGKESPVMQSEEAKQAAIQAAMERAAARKAAREAAGETPLQPPSASDEAKKAAIQAAMERAAAQRAAQAAASVGLPETPAAPIVPNNVLDDAKKAAIQAAMARAAAKKAEREAAEVNQRSGAAPATNALDDAKKAAIKAAMERAAAKKAALDTADAAPPATDTSPAAPAAQPAAMDDAKRAAIKAAMERAAARKAARDAEQGRDTEQDKDS